MSRANVELDFFSKEKANAPPPHPSIKPHFNRQRSFRDIQGAISKINRDILKSVIASGSANMDSNNVNFKSVPSTPKEDPTPFPALPVYQHISRPASSENVPDTAPLTIFYNGTVTVFDVPQDKAECILKLAVDVDGNNNNKEPKDPKLGSGDQQQQQLFNHGDLPIARRKSLQRFLEKRKERLTLVSPYACFT